MRPWLIDLAPRDDAGDIQALRYTRAMRDPWRVGGFDRVRALPVLSIELLADGFGRAGSTAGAGSLQLVNADGALDELLALAWEDAEIEVYEAETDAPAEFADFTLRSRHLGAGIRQDAAGVVTVPLKDLSSALDVPLNLARYGGTGGADGTAEYVNRVKPFAIGPQFNVPLEGKFINRAALIAQVHSRAMGGVLYDAGDPARQGVTDKGVPLINGGNYASYAALAAVDMSDPSWDGKYATCNAEGLIRLARTPKGVTCADFQGDAVGGYVEQPGAIITRLVAALWTGAGVTLDAAMLTALDADFPHPLKLYADREGVRVSDWIETVMVSVGGMWWVDELAVLRARIFEFSAPAGTIEDWHGTRPELVDALPRWNKLVLGYRPPTRVMSEDELAEIVLGYDEIEGAKPPVDADRTADNPQPPSWLTALIQGGDINAASVEAVLNVLAMLNAPAEGGADRTLNNPQPPLWLTALITASDLNITSVESAIDLTNAINAVAQAGADATAGKSLGVLVDRIADNIDETSGRKWGANSGATLTDYARLRLSVDHALPSTRSNASTPIDDWVLTRQAVAGWTITIVPGGEEIEFDHAGSYLITVFFAHDGDDAGTVVAVEAEEKPSGGSWTTVRASKATSTTVISEGAGLVRFEVIAAAANHRMRILGWRPDPSSTTDILQDDTIVLIEKLRL